MKKQHPYSAIRYHVTLARLLDCIREQVKDDRQRALRREIIKIENCARRDLGDEFTNRLYAKLSVPIEPANFSQKPTGCGNSCGKK